MNNNNGCMIAILAFMVLIDILLFCWDTTAGLLFLGIIVVSIIFAFIANFGLSVIASFIRDLFK